MSASNTSFETSAEDGSDIIMEDGTSTPNQDKIPAVNTKAFSTYVYNSGLRDQVSNIEIPPRTTSPVPSVYTVNSSIREKFFCNIEGRLYNALRPEHSWDLPADEQERKRIEDFHNMFKMIRSGRNYVGPVRKVLRPSPDRDKAVLDLGCGTGLWIRDMSQEFPWVSFVGIDLMPIQSWPLPPNCRVEVDDFNLDLSHFYDSFDLVHTRVIAGGVADYPRLISEIHKFLQPNGLVLMQDFNWCHIYNDAHEPVAFPLPENYSLPDLPSTRHSPYFNYTAFWMRLLGEAFLAKGGRIDQVPWTEELLRAHGGFEEIGAMDYWFPIGPWYDPPMDPHQWAHNYLGELQRRNILGLLSASRQVILTYGMTPEDWDELETHVVRECTRDCEQLRLSTKLTAVWAKKQDQGTPKV